MDTDGINDGLEQCTSVVKKSFSLLPPDRFPKYGGLIVVASVLLCWRQRAAARVGGEKRGGANYAKPVAIFDSTGFKRKDGYPNACYSAKCPSGSANKQRRDDQAQEQRTTRHPETRLTRRGRARTDCYVSHLGWTLGSWWPDHCNMLACLCASWHFHSAVVDHRVTKLIHPLIRRLLEHSSVYYDTST